MLSAAECDAWRSVGSPRATGAESDSARSRSAPVRPSGHRSLPFTAVPTTTSSVPRRKKLKEISKLKVTTCWSEKENCGSREATDGRAPSELNRERNRRRASFVENANEPFGENLCVGLRWISLGCVISLPPLLPSRTKDPDNP